MQETKPDTRPGSALGYRAPGAPGGWRRGDSDPVSPTRVSDAWQWLEPHVGVPRFGFVRRDGTGLLGVGIAETVAGSSMVDLLRQLSGREGAWFVGGSFDPVRPRDPWWAPFGGARAWRPRATLALPATTPPAGRWATSPPSSELAPDPGAPSLGLVPDRAQWQALTDRAASGISAGTFDKVVLARTITERAEAGALAWLRGPQRAREMPFLYEPEPGVAFAGLTPELLFDRVGTTVHSEALAGTDVNDPAGRARLLASDKDAREHALVVDGVRRVLEPMCRGLERSALDLAEAGSLVHRLVAFRGHLAPPVSDADLVERLHPTPAVAGTPSDAALAFLRAHEPFDRGWYAGPIGLVEPGRTSLAVALRCALWRGDARIAYAGAGWVAGSEAQAEWNETESKSLAVRRR